MLRKVFALTILGISAVLGTLPLVRFMAFLYAGASPRIVLDLSETGRLWFNTVLSLIFFLQHSGMVRKSFCQRLEKIIPLHYHGALYTITSGILVIALCALWQPSTLLFDVTGLPRVAMRAAFFLSVLVILWGLWALLPFDFFDLLGLKPILENLGAKTSPPAPFKIRGPYRWVRHPIYSFGIVLFWSSPTLTNDRLLFDVLWTIWMVIGAILEERNLVDEFGDDYRTYQKTVPLLIPRGFRPAYPNVKSNKSA
jgi:hypothetical protein